MSSRRIQLCAGFVILTLTLWLFGSAICGRQSFVFRDAAHYYAPLFQWNVSEWRSGRIPLWNPLEHLGLPTLGENTASVFYPGQLLLLAPIDFLWAYNLYIVSHVALAAWGAWRLARRFDCGPGSAGQAALAYAFSGAVVFQYCNVVFLVGAAWLPLALEAIDRLLESGSLRRALGLAACLAMMVLGGDPQMAYHVGLAGLLYAAILARSQVDSANDRGSGRTTACATAGLPSSVVERNAASALLDKPAVPPGRSRGADFMRRAAWLAGAGVMAAVLAAVQILPAWELASQSPRASDDSPRNVWELAAWTAKPPAALPTPADDEAIPADRGSLLLDARRGEFHMRHVYQFSVGPWRWLELAWPNFGGRQFPTHRRWLSSLEGEEKRIWAPSLYAGALVLPFAFGAWRRTRGPQWQSIKWRWIKWLAVWSALASLGEYGLGWALGGATQWLAGRSPAIGAEVGGVYWMMNVLLPGYVAFRYPAKLWTITALAIALFSARGWEDAIRGDDAGAPHRLKWLGAAGTVGAVAVFVARPWLVAWFSVSPADRAFGPLDARGAVSDLALGFAQGAIVCLIGWRLLRLRAASKPWAPVALLALTAIDLGLAHRWLVPCADVAAWQTKPAFDPPAAAGSEGARIYRDVHWLPEAWREAGSVDRMREWLAWDRNTLLPKYHLPLGIRNVESSGMMLPDDYAAFWHVARSHGPERPDGASLPDRSALDLVGAEYLVLPPGVRYDATTRITPAPIAPMPDATKPDATKSDATPTLDAVLWRNERALPRAWIVHDVEQLPPLDDRRPAAIRQYTERVLFPADKARDWRREAVIETATPIRMFNDSEVGEHAPRDDVGEFCRVQFASTQQVTLAARLARPGLLVLGDAYYPGWRVTVSEDEMTREAEILRTDRLLRGVALPAGTFRLDFVYAPRRVYWGLAISGLAWGGLSCAALRRSASLIMRRGSTKTG